jgi:hypothetical protein
MEIPSGKPTKALQVIDSFPEEREAEGLRDKLAANLKALGLTDRFGMFIQKECGVYQVVLRDRSAKLPLPKRRRSRR